MPRLPALIREERVNTTIDRRSSIPKIPHESHSHTTEKPTPRLPALIRVERVNTTIDRRSTIPEKPEMT